MIQKFLLGVAVALVGASSVEAAADFLKDFPHQAHHILKSGPQVIGKASFSWKAKDARIEFVEDSQMKLTLFKKPQLIRTKMDVWTSTKLSLEQIAFEMQSAQANLKMRGSKVGSKIRMKVTQAGNEQALEMNVQEPLLVSPTIRPYVIMKGLPKKTVTHQAFLLEPSALTSVPLTLEVKKIGKNRWSLDVRYLSQRLTSIIDATGRVIKETTDLAGLPIVATPVSAVNFKSVKLVGTQQDLVELSKVSFPEIKNSKALKKFSVKLSGIDLPSFELNRHRQTLKGNVLRIQTEKVPELSGPVQNLVGRSDLERYLKGDASIPVYEPVIQKQAQKIVGKETDVWKRALAIHRFVFKYLKKIPTISVPNALEVLQNKQGDCNEHAVLYTALARAAGVPTRTVVGLVYSDTFYGDPGFYYHAWVEVFDGKTWIALDPTWNQVPADATHIAFVEGGLDQQVQITSLMGKIRLTPVSSPKAVR